MADVTNDTNDNDTNEWAVDTKQYGRIRMSLPSSIKSVTSPEGQAAVRDRIISNDFTKIETGNPGDLYTPPGMGVPTESPIRNFLRSGGVGYLPSPTDVLRGITAPIASGVGQVLTPLFQGAGKLDQAVSQMQPGLLKQFLGNGGRFLNNQTDQDVQNNANYSASLAQDMIPQTPEDIGMLLLGGRAGQVAAKAGYGGLKAAGTRVLGTVAGGAVGSGLEGDPLTGAEHGLTGGLVGEGLVAAGKGVVSVGNALVNTKAVRQATGRLFKGGSASQVDAMQNYDAANVGKDVLGGVEDFGRIKMDPQTGVVSHDTADPIFGSPQTPSQLRDLVKSGKGYDALREEQASIINTIGDLLPKRPDGTPPMVRTPNGVTMEPSAGATMTTTEAAALRKSLGLPANADLAPYLKGAEIGGKPVVSSPDTLTPVEGSTSWARWPEVQAQLDKLRDIAGRSNAEPFYQIAYRKALSQLRQDLMPMDTKGKIGALLNAMENQYTKGQAILDTLSSAFKDSNPKRITFNTHDLQGEIIKNESALRSKLGDSAFNALETAAFRGAGTGYQDLYPSGGGVADQVLKKGLGYGAAAGVLHGAMAGNPVQALHSALYGAALGAGHGAINALHNQPQFTGMPGRVLSPAMTQGLALGGMQASQGLLPIVSDRMKQVGLPLPLPGYGQDTSGG